MSKLHELQGSKIGLGLRLQLFAFGNISLPRVQPTRTGLDVIGEVTFSRRFGFMDAQKDDGTFQRIRSTFTVRLWITITDRCMVGPYAFHALWHPTFEARNNLTGNMLVRSV